MRVPAIFASRTDGGLMASGAWFGCRGDPVPFAEAAASVPRGEARMPVAVVDMDSLSSREFREGVVKGMRVRGSDVWFMTHVGDADDLFDAFNTVAERVLAPVRTVDSREDLVDILSVSDSFVPVVEVRGGNDLWNRTRPLEAVRRLEGIGFPEVCVLDLDGSVDRHEWGLIAEEVPGCCAFAEDPSAPEGAGITRTISPIALRGPTL